MKRIIFRISSLVTILLLLNPAAMSAQTIMDSAQKRALQSGARYVNTQFNDIACSAAGTTTSAIPSGEGTTLDGHTLPAASGGVGLEERAVLQNGRAVLAPGTSNPGAGLNPAPKGATDTDARFYIAMRWRYRVWAWDGTTTKGPEAGSWYTQAPRKVLVTNPRTGKAVVATILESGPAPWTGTPEGSKGKRSPPSYWQGYVDGTPAGFNGRVAGLSPEAFNALGDPAMQWTNGGQGGYALEFKWADQTQTAGTVIAGGVATAPSADPTATSSSSCNTSGIPADQFVFYSQHDSAWKNHAFGTSTIDDAGCGPTSLAMVVATLSNRDIKPPAVADWGTQNNMYVKGVGSSHGLFTHGARHYGLTSAAAGTDINKVITAIKSGGLGIASGKGPVPFTRGGHIIVIRGVTAEGKLLVGDPNQPELDVVEYEQSELMKSVGNLWAITK